MIDLVQLHLVRCELGGIAFVPKHHFAAHLADRTAFSSPKSATCYTPSHGATPNRLVCMSCFWTVWVTNELNSAQRAKRAQTSSEGV
eukprot:3252057-Pyramimonas_sp.AAC.1